MTPGPSAGWLSPTASWARVSWRRWGVIVYGCAAVAGLGLDVLARAPVLHQVTVFVSAVAVFWLVYLNRERFRAGQ